MLAAPRRAAQRAARFCQLLRQGETARSGAHLYQAREAGRTPGACEKAKDRAGGHSTQVPRHPAGAAMILAGLMDEELLRVVQPQTELERLLVERLSAAVDEVEFLEEKLDEYRIEY